ncbi:MAG: aldehyde dehydrogenase family protein [Vulcanimicrobiaceae bacterium]
MATSASILPRGQSDAPPSAPEPTPLPSIEAALAELAAAKGLWARLALREKLAYLTALRSRTRAHARAWAETAAQAKGVAASPMAGEEWLSGPWAMLYALNRYERTLRALERTGSIVFPSDALSERRNGQLVVRVFPQTTYDRILLSGVTADVWMQPGITAENLQRHIAPFYRQVDPPGRVSLVLGAGNIAAIPPLDVLYLMFNFGDVCILKMNPVNAYLGPIFEQIFAPLIEGHFLRIVYGAGDVGSYLSRHPSVEAVHITGSARTHDLIVWGNDDPAQRAGRTPQLQKPITSELGNVSPTIVVPGAWSDADIAFHAEQIATQKLHNGGFNCIASQVLILPSDWPQTPQLLAALEHVLRAAPTRPAYYPGAEDRAQRLIAGTSPEQNSGASQPRACTLLRLDATDATQRLFQEEAFCNVLAYVELPGDAGTFLHAAVAFANDRLHGTLGANLIVDPRTQTRHASELDAAIAALRYGCVAVNTWTGVGFLLTEAPWGAFPGETIDDVRSGIGQVHNAFFFSAAQKSVVRGPFAPFPRSLRNGEYTLLPKPPWFITNRVAHRLGPALCDFEAAPSPFAAARVAAIAMQG